MNLLCAMLSRAVWLVGLVGVVLVMAGCDSAGNLTERPLSGPGGAGTIEDRNISGIAGPSDRTQLRPVEFANRATFASGNTVDALIYPSATAEERQVFQRALTFFITDRTPENGLGPLFNQRICLGCHRNSDDIATLNPATQFSGAPLVTVSTPASRASRHGPTDHVALNRDILAAIAAGDASIGMDETRGKPPTASFTLFGAFFPAAGAFNPEVVFGGPIQHVRSTPACFPDVIPDESADPFILGGIDPLTGLPVIGGRRAIGERAAPPYIGRGLMEAIFQDDIVALGDPLDLQGHNSSLASPAVTNPECPGDCISGRHNENAPGTAFPVLDPVVRVARFGLRAPGPTLLQFMLGGTQQEIGITNPFAPTENNNNQNAGRTCDVAPDPELTADDIFDLRRLIRLIAPPALDPCILGTSNTCMVSTTGTNTGTAATMRGSIENGMRLFGVDIAAFRSRMIPGQTPVGDPNGINQADRMLNCVGCHTPIMATGQSPAEIGAQHLSHRWFPIFSDLLIHDMGEVPAGPAAPVHQRPFSLDGGATFEISRNLADFALPGQGVATGRDWRTPPLMGLGKIGAPFLHDIRVYLSNRPNAPGGVRRPARTVQTSADGGVNQPLVVNTLDDAIRAAIELHDLPPPGPGCPAIEARNAAANPTAPIVPNGTLNAANAVCPAPNGGGTAAGQAGNRSEARNVMVRWRALTRAQQQDVINFLKGL